MVTICLPASCSADTAKSDDRHLRHQPLWQPALLLRLPEASHEKTCEKKNLRRDDIELQVAKAIKRRTLDDDTINWIADSVVEYSQHQESASGIGLWRTS